MKNTMSKTAKRGDTNDPILLKARKLNLLSICLVLSSVILLSIAISVQHRDENAKSLPTVQSAFKPGTQVNMGAVSIKVSDITYSDGHQPFAAPNGKQFVSMYLDVKNNAEKPLNILPADDMYIKNSTGDISYVAPFIATEPFRAGELLPGEQIRGQLSFLVPKSGSLKLFVDAVWSGGVLPFEIR